MNKPRSFSEPGCVGCEAHLDFGLSRYCAGFKIKSAARGSVRAIRRIRRRNGAPNGRIPASTASTDMQTNGLL